MSSLHNVQTVITATPAQVGTTGKRVLMRVIMYCAATGICEFKNAATDTGDVLLTITGLTNTTVGIVTLVTTTTNLTNLPAITANWLTASTF